MSEPPLVEMDTPSPQPGISETAGVKIIEHDFELLPKHVMIPEKLVIIKKIVITKQTVKSYKVKKLLQSR